MKSSTKSITGIVVGFVAAIVYILVPTDLLNDAIPVAGWLDDTAAILLAVANAIRIVVKMKN